MREQEEDLNWQHADILLRSCSCAVMEKKRKRTEKKRKKGEKRIAGYSTGLVPPTARGGSLAYYAASEPVIRCEIVSKVLSLLQVTSRIPSICIRYYASSNSQILYNFSK